MGEMFTHYVLGELIKIWGSYFFFFPYVSSKSKECLLFLQCNREDSVKNRNGIFNNRSIQSLWQCIQAGNTFCITENVYRNI